MTHVKLRGVGDIILDVAPWSCIGQDIRQFTIMGSEGTNGEKGMDEEAVCQCRGYCGRRSLANLVDDNVILDIFATPWL